MIGIRQLEARTIHINDDGRHITSAILVWSKAVWTINKADATACIVVAGSGGSRLVTR
jgi:hypothetical protein